jgi:SAM-dependent methyltransferase
MGENDSISRTGGCTLGDMTGSTQATANAEAIQAWDGPLFERWLRYRHIYTEGLGAHGEEALRICPPQPGERVLDVGCGLGDTTQRIAELVGPEGEAVGVDAAPRMIEIAQQETREQGIANARFDVIDVQAGDLGGPYDMAFSRMGTMFFANPVAAMRNVRSALKPGGRLAMVVWRRREDNEWAYRPQRIVEGIVSRPEEYEEPTCGPGPFSMAGADTTSDILMHSGFIEIALHRCDLPIKSGKDIEEAIDVAMAVGPGAEIIRLQGERAADRHDEIRQALREGMAEFERPDGVWAAASTWIVTARTPS